ncbi:MAG: hypothetical protein OHK0022_17890 [Roseiflexaceae bacterium]
MINCYGVPTRTARGAAADQLNCQLHQIEKLMVDRETGLRGYLLTGNPEFLEPYNAAEYTLPTSLNHLSTLVADNPSQIQRIAALDEQTVLPMEDNQNDVLLLKRAMRRAQWNNPVQVAEYGDAAITYLERTLNVVRDKDALVSDLLEYSRLGRALLQLQPIALAAAVEVVLSELQPLLAARGARVRVGALAADVIAERRALHQVLANMLRNAVTYVAPGSGVGLAIVRRGVERMGGQAGVESQLGQGNRFWIVLPLAGA